MVKGLNDRERFLRTMKFQKVDRPIFTEFMGFWKETVNKWYKQGLPFNVRPDGEGKVGAMHVSVGVSSYFLGISEYFGFDKCGIAHNIIDLDFGPIPRFVRKVLEETKRYRIEVDEAGIIKKTLLADVSIPGWIDFPIKSKEDFENMKKRFNPQDIRRYPKSWSKELIEHLRNSEVPLGLEFPGFFGQLRSFMGLERLIKFMYVQRDFINEILDFWKNFLIETMRELVKNVKIDYAYVWEDMCYNNGPLISPKLFEDFMLHHYKAITKFLKENGVEVIMVDSDGDCSKIIPLLIEGGVNCLLPLEVNANMDALKLREEYGKKLCMIGNIDKRALIKGEEAIKKEVKKVPQLVDEGGYIASTDHGVPHNVPLKNYLYYLKLLKKSFGIDSNIYSNNTPHE